MSDPVVACDADDGRAELAAARAQGIVEGRRLERAELVQQLEASGRESMRAVPIDDETRHCAYSDCGAVLVRKWRPSGFEHPSTFERRLANEERRQIEREVAPAYRLLTRAEQAARVEAYLQEARLHEYLGPTQFGVVRLLAALCWRHRGLVAAQTFVKDRARTVRAGVREGVGA